MYIHGGRDIKEGPMGNMWKMSIGGVHELMDDPENGVCWETVNCKGTIPGKISHHKAAVFGLSVIVFGGIDCLDNFEDTFEFNSQTNTWSKIKQSGDIPKPCDDLSISQIDDSSLLIFGGFCSGSRVNSCYIATKTGSTLEWKEVGQNSPDKPCVRASHSSVVHGRKCYIFGGQDDENNKLNDLWEFDLDTEIFSQIELSPNSYQPMARSGHSANLYNGKMYIFGGIFEITKELSELLVYDFDTQSFECIAGESGEPGA
jgi:hypothetical protein